MEKKKKQTYLNMTRGQTKNDTNKKITKTTMKEPFNF
jgi:hypothetical protein